MAAEPLGKRLSAVCPPALARLLPTGPQPKRVQPPSARPDGRALCAGTAAEPAAGPDSGEHPPYEVLDTVPVPLRRRCRGDRQHLFGLEAAIGQGGSDKDWYYGVSLLSAVTPSGFLSGFVLGTANNQER